MSDFLFATFWEGSTGGSELGGDVNRDGDSDDWIGILYDPEDHLIWVDSDEDIARAVSSDVKPLFSTATGLGEAAPLFPQRS